MAGDDYSKAKRQVLIERWHRIHDLAVRMLGQYDTETRIEEKVRLEPLILEKKNELAAIEREIQLFERKTGTATMPPRVFYSYAHEDEELRDELANHLRPLERQEVISGWYDRDLAAGIEGDKETRQQLLDAEIVLLLVSSDFLASEYIWNKELNVALELHSQGKARVVPIILRPCDWPAATFAHLQALPLGKTRPRDIEPVTEWRSRDEAFASIAKSLRELALSLRS